MRVFLSLFILLLALSTFAQVPDYLENNPQWRQDWTFGYYYPCIHEHHYIYYLNGDSTVGNLTYKKLFKRGEIDYRWYAAPPPYNCNGTELYDEFYALIRQDSLKIYLREYYTDTLLYDFDLSVGDTLPQTYNMWVDTVVVQSIDSILIGDSYRKIFYLPDYGIPPTSLIEGIGFDSGLLEEYGSWEFPYILVCFALNDTTYYPSYGAPCDLAVNIPVMYVPEKITYSPNPVTDLLYISTKGIGKNTVIITSISGQQILSRESSGEEQTIDLSTCPRGVYFLTIRSKDFVTVEKILKR